MPITKFVLRFVDKRLKRQTRNYLNLHFGDRANSLVVRIFIRVYRLGCRYGFQAVGERRYNLILDAFQWPSWWRSSSAGHRFTPSGWSPYSGPVTRRPATLPSRTYHFCTSCTASPRTCPACSTTCPPPSIPYCTTSCRWNFGRRSRYVKPSWTSPAALWKLGPPFFYENILARPRIVWSPPRYTV